MRRHVDRRQGEPGIRRHPGRRRDDLLTEPDLLKAAKEELTKRLAGRTYQAVQHIDPKTWDESAWRFGEGPGEEALIGVEDK